MLWCLTGAALTTLLAALAALIVHPPRLHTPRPGRLLRGCVATVLLVLALGLGGLALAVAQWQG